MTSPSGRWSTASNARMGRSSTGGLVWPRVPSHELCADCLPRRLLLRDVIKVVSVATNLRHMHSGSRQRSRHPLSQMRDKPPLYHWRDNPCPTGGTHKKQFYNKQIYRVFE